MNKNKEGARWFWRTSLFLCPFCGKTFTYETMWIKIVETLKTTTKIMDKLGISFPIVRRCAHMFNLGLQADDSSKLSPTQWELRAKEVGFDSAKDMFFDLRVTKNNNYKTIARILGVGYSETMRACKAFLVGDWS